MAFWAGSFSYPPCETGANTHPVVNYIWNDHNLDSNFHKPAIKSPRFLDLFVRKDRLSALHQRDTKKQSTCHCLSFSVLIQRNCAEDVAGLFSSLLMRVCGQCRAVFSNHRVISWKATCVCPSVTQGEQWHSGTMQHNAMLHAGHERHCLLRAQAHRRWQSLSQCYLILNKPWYWKQLSYEELQRVYTEQVSRVSSYCAPFWFLASVLLLSVVSSALLIAAFVRFLFVYLPFFQLLLS